MVKAFIQARMSSRRFPGKVLAPFNGMPIILHVVNALKKIININDIIVATSIEISDDPLCAYLEKIGITVFRGELDNVFNRFKQCFLKNPCDWILRICADSPVVNVDTLQNILKYTENGEFDLVTTTFPRTFPKGQNAELIKTDTFIKIDEDSLSGEEKEHMTMYFYNNYNKFNINNVTSGNPALSDRSFAVDTIDDLIRLEKEGI